MVTKLLCQSRFSTLRETPPTSLLKDSLEDPADYASVTTAVILQLTIATKSAVYILCTFTSPSNNNVSDLINYWSQATQYDYGNLYTISYNNDIINVFVTSIR